MKLVTTENIYNKIDSFFINKKSIQDQIKRTQEIIKNFKKLFHIRIYLFPKGLNTNNKAGNNVSTDIIANSIAIPVNIPKYIVGIKLDKTKIENPKTIVIEVFNIATPTVE